MCKNVHKTEYLRIKNLFVEKETLLTVLGFEPRSFYCRSTALTIELHRRPASAIPFQIN